MKGKRIVKTMTFGELLEISPKAAELLSEKGMFCGCCPMAMMETIEQGACAHNVDVDKLIEELNSLY